MAAPSCCLPQPKPFVGRLLLLIVKYPIPYFWWSSLAFFWKVCYPVAPPINVASLVPFFRGFSDCGSACCCQTFCLSYCGKTLPFLRFQSARSSGTHRRDPHLPESNCPPSSSDPPAPVTPPLCPRILPFSSVLRCSSGSD